MFNRRVGTRTIRGSWVRIRPPTMEEAQNVQDNPWYLPFVRVGSLGDVVADVGEYIDLSIAGVSVLIERETFLSTWVRAVSQREWRVRPGAHS